MNRKGLSFKDEAYRALSRKAWREALEHFKRHCAQAPQDLRSRLKVAELLERLRRKEEAIQMYQEVAEAYAQDGFLLQAISINKMILRLDPSFEKVNQRLAHLYAEKAKDTKLHLPPIPLFSELSEKELQSFLPLVQSKTFLKDSVICQEGERGDSLFVIIRGEVAIMGEMAKRKETEICTLKEGDFFGEFGFFVDHKRHASVRAVTECEILEIPRDKLNNLIKIHPRVKEVLHSFFERRVLDTILAHSPLFSSLTYKEKEEVIKRFRIVKLPEETSIFHQGDLSTSLYLIKRGEVEIFAQNRTGKRIQLLVMKSGHFFGEIGALFNKPRVASAKTTCPSELLELTKEELDACLSKFPHFQLALREISSRRLHQLQEILSGEGVEKAVEAMV